MLLSVRSWQLRPSSDSTHASPSRKPRGFETPSRPWFRFRHGDAALPLAPQGTRVRQHDAPHDLGEQGPLADVQLVAVGVGRLEEQCGCRQLGLVAGRGGGR